MTCTMKMRDYERRGRAQRHKYSLPSLNESRSVQGKRWHANTQGETTSKLRYCVFAQTGAVRFGPADQCLAPCMTRRRLCMMRLSGHHSICLDVDGACHSSVVAVFSKPGRKCRIKHCEAEEVLGEVKVEESLTTAVAGSVRRSSQNDGVLWR